MIAIVCDDYVVALSILEQLHSEYQPQNNGYYADRYPPPELHCFMHCAFLAIYGLLFSLCRTTIPVT